MSVVKCPYCQNPITTDPMLAGHVVACPHCRNQLQMPAAQSAIPVPPPLPPQAGAFDFLNEPDSTQPLADPLDPLSFLGGTSQGRESSSALRTTPRKQASVFAGATSSKNAKSILAEIPKPIKIGGGCLIAVLSLMLLGTGEHPHHSEGDGRSVAQSGPSLAEAEERLLRAAQGEGEAQVSYAQQIIGLVRSGQPFWFEAIDGGAVGLFREKQSLVVYYNWKDAVIRETNHAPGDRTREREIRKSLGMPD